MGNRLSRKSKTRGSSGASQKPDESGKRIEKGFWTPDSTSAASESIRATQPMLKGTRVPHITVPAGFRDLYDSDAVERRGPPESGIFPPPGNDSLGRDGPPPEFSDSPVITPEDDPLETDWTAGLDLQKGGGGVVKQTLTTLLSSCPVSSYHGLDTLVGLFPSNSSSKTTYNRGESEHVSPPPTNFSSSSKMTNNGGGE